MAGNKRSHYKRYIYDTDRSVTRSTRYYHDTDAREGERLVGVSQNEESDSASDTTSISDMLLSDEDADETVHNTYIESDGYVDAQKTKTKKQYMLLVMAFTKKHN